MLTKTQPYQRDLGNGMVLKSVADERAALRVAEFDGVIHDPGVRDMAHELILNHPNTRPEHWLFIEDEPAGQVVSALCLIPWRWRYEGVELTSGEMGIVGTAEAYRSRGLIRALVHNTPSIKVDQLAQSLHASLAAIYAVARESHGPAMAQVEQTVLLDALTEVWRQLASERPDLRQQSDLYAYANKQPADIYRTLAGQAYHGALAAAARTAASVLVTFPLPREIKTQRTGLEIEEKNVLDLLVEG